jgi:hypothetical protein
MEGISEARLLSFLCGQGLNRLQIEVIVEMQIVQILSVNQEVQHVVPLADHLQASFHPIKFSQLEKFGLRESFHERSLALRLWSTVVQLIQNPDFE